MIPGMQTGRLPLSFKVRKTMVYEGIWSYTFDRIEEYILGCGAERSNSVYSMDGCDVELESLPDRPLGPLAIPQTRVRISGQKAEALYQEFYLHFLSGGA